MFILKTSPQIKKSSITLGILLALASSSFAVKTKAATDSEYMTWSIDYNYDPRVGETVASSSASSSGVTSTGQTTANADTSG